MNLSENTKIYLLLLIIFILCVIGELSAQSIKSVKTHLNASQIQHKEIVLQQIILETGWLSSYSCKHRHNLFGFRYKGEYLIFDSWQDSIAYYQRWQKRHYKGGDYYQFLTDRGYATDKNYINKLKQITVK